jgi:Cell wall-associated hydrolases (invasion-associated proteins)
MSATREQVVTEALSWVGTPYLHQGYVKGAQGGVDCAMILVGVYEPLGLLPKGIDPRPYPMQWHLHKSAERYLDWFRAHAREVEEPGLGDIALYKFGRAVSHSAIIVGENVIVHAYRKAGMVIRDEQRALESRFDSYWSLF